MKKVIYVLTVLLVIGILAGCNSTDVPAAPDKESSTADTSVDTDIGKTTAAEVGSNSAQITEKAPETAAESNTAGGVGGAVPDWYRLKYNDEYGSVDINDFEGIFTSDDFNQWLITEHGYSETLSSANAEIFDFLPELIRYFNIPKEKFPIGGGSGYTQEMADALYSNDQNKINEVFVSPYAIFKNGEIYTPEWLDTHTLEEFNEVGITLEDIVNKIENDWCIFDYEYYYPDGGSNEDDLLPGMYMELFVCNMKKLCRDNGVSYTVPSTN